MVVIRKRILGIIAMFILCISTLCSCFWYSGEGDKLTGEEKKNHIEKIATEYIQNKYGVSATTLGYYDDRMDFGKPRKEQMYYVVPMQLSDKSFDKNTRGYFAIKKIRLYQFLEDIYENLDFYVYIQADNYEVIGDSYMWYKVYPWLDRLIDDNIEQYAPCSTVVNYVTFFVDDMTEYFMFPSDYSIPESDEQYREFLSDASGALYFFIRDGAPMSLAMEEWNTMSDKLDECGLSGFNMYIAIVSNKSFNQISKTHNFDNIECLESISIKEN